MGDNYNSVIIPLKHRVKEVIYLSYEEVLESCSVMEKYPTPPNKLEFKSCVMKFYKRIRSKLVSALEKKDLEGFKDIKKLDTIRSITDEKLTLELCLDMVFRFGDFLDAINITKIDFDKPKASTLYNYNS